MDLANFEKMDPIILMSIVNMKIRNEFGNLENLTKFFDIDQQQLIDKLTTAGFDYLPEAKQFR
ncbi:DUF4250 domain-containing protein [Vibrio hibernica]|uniref:DUF4250 domain-containing protein n=1 Tax=Vibrio hibernica TaxID=2587465 RepID=UPI00187F9535|nr:DUF4250 domain-containing protein [Vibrio hibernica]